MIEGRAVLNRGSWITAGEKMSKGTARLPKKQDWGADHKKNNEHHKKDDGDKTWGRKRILENLTLRLFTQTKSVTSWGCEACFDDEKPRSLSANLKWRGLPHDDPLRNL